jgi:hypothetical protein
MYGTYKTIWSRSWSRSCNSDLRLREAGAARNIFGPATPLQSPTRRLISFVKEKFFAKNNSYV